jgi:hypothetical protein
MSVVMGQLAEQIDLGRGITESSETFRGKGWWSLETISVDNNYVTYKKRSSLFAPMFTITVPRLSIRNVELTETITGTLLRITTLSNNNIFSRNFAKGDMKRIKALLRK